MVINTKPNTNSTGSNSKVIISSEDITGDVLKDYICPNCRLIIRARGNPTEVFCNKCQNNIIIGPDPNTGTTITPQTQQVQTLIDPNKDIMSEQDAAVISIQYDPNAGISHTKHGQPIQLKDGALALSKRNTLRFTSYHDSSE
jgi:hypothetical protein